MKTEIFTITNIEQQRSEIEAAAAYLRAGELVAIPTETVYGLGANALDGNAVKKIFAAKGRPQDNPLIVHIAEVSELYAIAREVPESALRLAAAYWPGPLTMILPKGDAIPPEVSAGLDTVAIRMPSHPVANAVIRAAGVPVAAPSANISGFPSPTAAQYVIDDMNGRIAAIVDGGDCEYGIESTVVTLATDPPELLRPGAVTVEQLRAILGEVAVNPAVLNPLAEGAQAASPGMKYKHYSPRAEISIVRGDLAAFAAYCAAHPDDADAALVFEGEETATPLPCVTFGREDDALSQAHRLFDALRELDAMGAKKVFARSPSPQGVGLGVCNRLYRAAAFRFLPEPGKIIGVTGASGSGKSTVCDLLRQRGAVIIDADAEARRVTEPGSPALGRLATAFGADILRPDGSLDRRLLASRAFADKEKTDLLVSITHPAIVERCRAQAQAARDAGRTAVIDAPLLFSSGLDKICDLTVRVEAPEAIRAARIRARDNISDEEIAKRFAAQAEEAALSRSADVAIRNYPPYELEEEIKRI
ncbi:MAG: threonylcarbamoyl-AMP synthase [Clostridia bacterium]|nr:threonylcarbamoyl-AMP synthase [Clostridia bacterium]